MTQHYGRQHIREIARLGRYVYAYLRQSDDAHGRKWSPYYIGLSKTAVRPFQRSHNCAIPTNARFIRVLKSGLTEQQARAYEKFYIAHYGYARNGGCLDNGCAGGQGSTGHVVTDEVRAVISATHSGRVLTDEHKEKISAAVSGIPRTQTQIDALVATNRSRKWEGEMLAKRSRSRIINTARKYSLCPALYASIELKKQRRCFLNWVERNPLIDVAQWFIRYYRLT
jgi:hypothetical protein